MENLQYHNGPKITADEEDFNLHKIVGIVLHYWWLFLVVLLAALSVAFIYLRYSTPLYKVTAKILVKDPEKGGAGLGMGVFEGLGIKGSQNTVDNEVELLKSRTLMENTVSALQLNVSYYVQGKVKETEVFAGTLPFILSLNDRKIDSLQQPIQLKFNEINNNEFKLIVNNVEKNYRYDDSLTFPFGKLVFSKNAYIGTSNAHNISIIINPPDNSVAGFQGKLGVAVTTKTVSTIDLTLNDAVPERGEQLLNTLIRIYNRMNIEDKNRVADSTITFIDNRLVYVTRELGNVEQNIEQFRQRNRLTDLSEQGRLLLENTSDYFKELSKAEVQISIVESLENYLKNENNIARTIPAGLVIEDPTFASQIEKYNTFQLEKGRQLQTTTENNPVVQRLTVQIADLRADIVANLATVKRTMQITRAQLRNRTNSFESQIQQVPRKERAFLEISRQQAIKQELYLYLLKKKRGNGCKQSCQCRECQDSR